MALYEGAVVKTNTMETLESSTPMVVGLAGGGYVVAWNRNNVVPYTGVSDGIYARIYDADGVAIGTETAATDRGGTQTLTGITALDDGGYTLAWTTYDANSFGILQQDFDSSGTLDGGQTAVNLTTYGAQHVARLDNLPGGGWIAAYTTWTNSTGYIITFRAFDTDGNPVALNGDVDGNGIANDTRVSVSGAGGESDAQITVLEDGGWVVTWTSTRVVAGMSLYGGDGYYDGVFQRVYNSDGTARTGELGVNVTTSGFERDADVTALKGGGYVVTWERQDSEGTVQIFQRAFNADGSALSDTDTLVSNSTTGSNYDSSVTALENGGWVVVWTSNVGGATAYQEVYGSDGAVLIEETQIASNVRGVPEVSALADGGWVVAWNAGFLYQGEVSTIVHRRFGFTNAAPEGFDKTVTIKEDKASALSANYFGFDDVDDNALTGVVITGLPAKGTLKLNGVAVTAGQTIDAADLGNLTYAPPADASGAGLAKIKFKVVDDGGTAYDSVNTDATANTLTFNVTEVIDVFTGNDKSTTLTGTQGADRFLAKGGNDKLNGLGGIDTFLFRSGDDKDVITDFVAKGTAHDILDLSDLASISNFTDLKANHMAQSGKNVVIDGLDGDMITLIGVKLVDLDKGDFLF
jgi:hypothetical protein